MNRILMATLCGLLAAAATALSPAGGQEFVLQPTVVSISDGDYPNARAIVSIEDSADAGAPLDASNFSVTVDGAAAAVVSAELVSSEDAALDVLFVIDTSGSMEGAPLAGAKEAAKALIGELDPADRVGLIHFGNDVTLAQDFTSDRALLTGAIDALVARGNTALYQATSVGALTIGSSPAPRRAVVLLSDGADFGGRSVATREEAIGAAQATGVPFFVIAQGSDLDRGYLQQLAGVGRGRYLEAPQPEDLRTLYVGIGRLLRSQYAVTFDAAAVPAAGAEVIVTITQAERSGSAALRYAPGLSFVPTIAVEGLAPGESLDAPRELRAVVSAGTPRVSWHVDGVNVLETAAPPYVYTFDPAQHAGGAHTLRAVIEGVTPIETSITFSSSAAAGTAGGGGVPLVLLLAAGGGLAGLALAGFVFMKKRDRAPAGIPAEQRMQPWAAQIARRAADAAPADAPEIADAVVPEAIGEPMGLLISRSGNDTGKEYLVGGRPVSIGAGARCGVRIDDPELSGEEARIWVRNEHLMLHRFTRLTTLEAEGVSGGWQILDAGDTFEIGQHTFEFKPIVESEAALLSAPSPDAPPAPPSQPGRFSDLMPRSD